MAFRYERFTQVGVNNNPSIPSVYAYNSLDPLSAVLSADYFTDGRLELNAGDVVITCADGATTSIFISSDGTTATLPEPIAPTFEPITADTTLTGAGGSYDVDASAGNVTITMPAFGAGKSFNFRKINLSGGNVILSFPGSTINGETTATIIAQHDVLTVATCSTEWGVI